MPLFNLALRNFILVREAYLEFCPGFNVLTGETGAGKSMLLGALKLIAGTDVDWEVLRGEEDEIELSATFRIGDETVRVTRFIDPKKRRSRAELNGKSVSKQFLRERIAPLLEIHGQHENERLLNPETHLDFYDRAISAWELRLEVEDLYDGLKRKEAELRQREEEREKLKQMRMFQSYQLEELKRAELKEGEIEELEEKIGRLSNIERLRSGVGEVLDLLYRADDSAYSKAASALRILEELSSLDATLKSYLEAVSSFEALIDDVWRELLNYEESLVFDPEELERLRGRLAYLKELERKYGKTIDELIAYRDELERELSHSEELIDLEPLRREIEELRREFSKRVEQLSKIRRERAAEFEKGLLERLNELGFGKVNFVVKFIDTEPGPRGKEDVNFLFSANPGKSPLPLYKIASGGELSRFMLALRTMLVDPDYQGTLIFDEIDQGIGGRVAQIVGRELRKLAGSHQVIVVTHLPQIAAFGEKHFVVRKITGEWVKTEVSELSREERIDEIARMLAGERITETSRLHALSLLEEAG